MDGGLSTFIHINSISSNTTILQGGVPFPTFQMKKLRLRKVCMAFVK